MLWLGTGLGSVLKGITCIFDTDRNPPLEIGFSRVATYVSDSCYWIHNDRTCIACAESESSVPHNM